MQATTTSTQVRINNPNSTSLCHADSSAIGDNRSLHNKADAEARYQESEASNQPKKAISNEAKLHQMDPTKPVCPDLTRCACV